MNTQHPSGQAAHNEPGSSARLLLDAFDRVHELVSSITEDLTVDELLWRPDADANPIGWLLWHLTRVQDSHLADLNGSEQIWTAENWTGRFSLAYDVSDIGYGQNSGEVGKFVVEDPALLNDYHTAVHAKTAEILGRIDEKDFDRVIDDSYDPPVTVGARLVSVVNDTTQHVGQASYVRGLVERRRK